MSEVITLLISFPSSVNGILDSAAWMLQPVTSKVIINKNTAIFLWRLERKTTYITLKIIKVPYSGRKKMIINLSSKDRLKLNHSNTSKKSKSASSPT